jgi:lycopene cyclase domain-containing protein
MTYWALNAIFLFATAMVALAAILTRRTPPWASVGIGLAVLLLTTAVFDNVMIGIGLVGYDGSLISGVFIGIAPLEDFAYPIAAAVLLPAVWSLVSAGKERG